MKIFNRHGAGARRRLCRMMALLLTVVLLAGILPQGQITAEAAQTKQRTIGIVFDNSGSMYMNGATEWCRAIYAMEVFASMANDGDRIIIYPMWEITVDGESYDMHNPFEVIIGTDDPASIRNIYTETAGGTPIETIEVAYSDLASRSADEKWLIVLTDGDEFHRNSTSLGEQTEAELTTLLTEYSQKMNLLYLGIGSQAAEPDIPSNSDYVSDVEIVADSREVLSTLTDMCNTIYGRDEIANVSSSGVTFDVSMTKLIVFVQGSDISGLALYDSSGNEVEMETTPYTPSYSTTFCGNTKASYYMTCDTSLSGTIATYEDLDAGSYTIEYTGTASSVGVYYEPNVSAIAYLEDADGNRIEAGDPAYSGTYYLYYGLVDKDGNLTESELLGDREYTITYTIDGVEYTETSQTNGRVELNLEEEQEMDADVTITYLSDYTVTADKDSSLWAFPLVIGADPLYDLEVSVSGGASSYTIKEFEDEAVYNVTVSYSGEKLTGDALAAVDLTAALDETGDTAPVVSCELSSDQTCYVVSLSYPNGGANSLGAQDYTLKVQASYVEEKGHTVTSNQKKVTFAVEAYGYDLGVSIDASAYYSIYELNGSSKKTVTVDVTHDGEPLTAEEMEQVTLEFDAGGFAYTVEKDAANSQFVVTLDGTAEDGSELETGNYQFAATVSTVDELGNTVTASTTKNTSVGLVPKWMMVLFGILILALIALLIWLYMNMKVLPKKIRLSEGGATTWYRIGAKQVNASNIVIENYKGNRKRGMLDITVPNTALGPGCSIHLDLEAVDPRRTPHAERRARVTGVDVPARANQFSVGSVSYSMDAIKNGKLCRNGDSKRPLADIGTDEVLLGNGQKCRVSIPKNRDTGTAMRELCATFNFGK